MIQFDFGCICGQPCCSWNTCPRLSQLCGIRHTPKSLPLGQSVALLKNLIVHTLGMPCPKEDKTAGISDVNHQQPPYTIPDKWQAEKMAGDDVMTSFLSRHPYIFIMSAEATYLACATAFNKKNNLSFFNNTCVEIVIHEHNFKGRNILNLNESGVTTVQNVPKVISEIS